MEIVRHRSGSPWEVPYGYCRAVRCGDLVEVAGTVAVDADGAVVAPGDPGEQTRVALARIATALQAAGARLDQVVRTRLYVVDIAAHADAVGRAHGEVFAEAPPVTTMVQVAALIDPAFLVEIEASAYVTG